MGVILKSSRELEAMRLAGQIASQCLEEAVAMVKPGMFTEEIDIFVHEWIISRGHIPAPLNYRGFPKSVCTSVNDVICHGIPGQEKLQDGDIINVDVTVIVDGFHGDTSRTVGVGQISSEDQRLVDCAYHSMWAGIKAVAVGARLGDIGYACQQVSDAAGFGMVRDYCGHGIGRNFHEDPNVLHYGEANTGLKLRPGMIFTIEPMVNAGSWETRLMDDGWTVRTVDGGRSAQFEHTLALTDDGVEVLTLGHDQGC